jgi:hypothetical protein
MSHPAILKAKRAFCNSTACYFERPFEVGFAGNRLLMARMPEASARATDFRASALSL